MPTTLSDDNKMNHSFINGFNFGYSTSDRVHFQLRGNFPQVTSDSSLGPSLCVATGKATQSQASHSHVSFIPYFQSAGNPALTAHGAKEVYTLVQLLFIVMC